MLPRSALHENGCAAPDRPAVQTASEHEHEQRVDDVQTDIGQMKAGGIRPPDLPVERVGEKRQRAVVLEELEGAEIRERLVQAAKLFEPRKDEEVVGRKAGPERGEICKEGDPADKGRDRQVAASQLFRRHTANIGVS